MIRNALAAAVVLVVLASSAQTGAEETDLQFTPMFNGKDLAGWVPVNVAPSTFTVKDGVIHSTGVPTGVMRTKRQYENFVIELDWMHEKPAGNAGLFLWGEPLTAPGTPFAKGIEIQILDDAYVTGDAKLKNMYTGHGDIFPIHGAKMTPDRPHPLGWDRCLPSENRAKPAGEWNHYRVEAKDGVVKLAVNGKVVSGGTACVPRKGYLCLESEGSPAQFKNIRIAELPSSNPKPEECASVAEDFKSLYTGVDLSNWRQDPGHKGHWRPHDWRLEYDGKSESKDKILWTEKEFGDFVLIFDWRFAIDPAKPPAGFRAEGAIHMRGNPTNWVTLGYHPAEKPISQWNRTTIKVEAGFIAITTNGQVVAAKSPLGDAPPRGPIGLGNSGGPMEYANVFIRELPAN